MYLRFNYPTGRTPSPDEAHLEVVEDVAPWRALFQIDLPAGVTRHPQLLPMVQDRLPTPNAADLWAKGVVVGFPLESIYEEAARQEAQRVADDLLGFLGLATTALAAMELYPPA